MIKLNENKKSFNFILQSKGGVGKSFISSILAQYYLSKNAPLVCFDTDPNNATLMSYKSLGAKFIELLDSDNKINPREFDKLVEFALTNADNHYVVDNGATSFIPFLNYINSNEILPMLGEYFNIFVHVPITGGQAQADTLAGLYQLLKYYASEVNFIVWKNEFFGKVQNDDDEFEDMEIYKSNQKNIKSIITIKAFDAQTFGVDIIDMTKARLTFNEVAGSENFTLMSKSRLHKFKKYMYDQLTNLPYLGV